MTDELNQLRRERDDLRESLAAQERSAALRQAVLADDLAKLAMRQIAVADQVTNAVQNYRRECAKVVQLARALSEMTEAGKAVCETCMTGAEYQRWTTAVGHAVEALTLLEIPF